MCLPGLSKDDMWAYFEGTVCPEVQARQPSVGDQVRPKIEVLLERMVLKKPPLSKVKYLVDTLVTRIIVGT